MASSGRNMYLSNIVIKHLNWQSCVWLHKLSCSLYSLSTPQDNGRRGFLIVVLHSFEASVIKLFLDFYVKCVWKRPHVTYKKVILVVFVFYTLSHWLLHEFCLANSRVAVQHTNDAAMPDKNMTTAPPETKNNISILYVFTFADLMYLSVVNGVKLYVYPHSVMKNTYISQLFDF